MTASSSTKAGSNAAMPSCAMPISGSAIDWWAPPSGAKRQARRRRHQNEARVLITGIVERIQAAGDERIVERADGNEPLAVDRVRQAERREQDEQIILGNAELDVLALGGEIPIERRGMRSLRNVSASASRANRPRRLTQPPRLVDTVTSGEVVTIRSTRSDLSRASSLSSAPKPALRRHFRLNGHRELVGRRKARRREPPRAAGGERHAVEEILQDLGLMLPALRSDPIRVPARMCIA